jgi:hypothetical protein
LKDQTRNYLAASVAGMSAEEAAVAAFLSLRLDELEREQKRVAAGAGFEPAASLTGPSLQ